MERKSKVLVVDDELGCRESIKMILENQFDVLTADRGENAIEQAAKGGIDCAILDIKMPGMNGIEVLRNLKQIDPEIEVLMATAYARTETAMEAIKHGAFDYISKPFDKDELIDIVKRATDKRLNRLKEKSMLNELQEAVVTADLKASQLSQELQRNYAATVKALVAAIDAKDAYTQGHSERVTQMVVKIARKLDLPSEQITLLENVAILHDIGKIGVSEEILNKPARLEKEEFETIKRHPVIGAGIISPVEFLKNMVPVVYHHHEHFDGTGYPSGLKNGKIPLEARILAVADAYDAMTSHRPYRKRPLTKEEAVEELRKNAGTQFDPNIVNALISALETEE